ncbi:MAG: hypothetical protein AAGH79_18960, partial [Bacteroidota bacterium]
FFANRTRMTDQQIQQFQHYLGPETELIHTHLSWVLITDQYAFKIKKPLHFSFVDFSTLERRKYFCQREVSLNNRLSNGIYLGVCALYESKESIQLEENGTAPIGYAVQMRKLPKARQMDVLLKKGGLMPLHLQKLAKAIATFHQSATINYEEPDLPQLQEDFADLASVKPFIHQAFSPVSSQLIDDSIRLSKQFIQLFAPDFTDRKERAQTVDGHGDLHSGNIFLLKEGPIPFDCIEFNDHLRQVDVLNEVAFLVMDLEYHNQKALGEAFLNAYFHHHPGRQSPSDGHIFLYYKLYRANVRLKVSVLAAEQMESGPAFDELLRSIARYLRLYTTYAEQLSSVVKAYKANASF